MHFEPHMLPSGHTLYEYRIERVLGAGGFGITYLGRDTHLGRWYAIKEYLPRDTAVRETGATVRSISATTQEDFTWGMDRFLAEAQTLAQFQHPNLVGVVRYFKANGTAYFVMDYVEGEVLASYIAREAPLSEAVLRGILAPVMDGLMQVHGAGYLHRDIKPDNIVLREDGSPVLVDFGAARLAMGARTRPLTAILTPGYAPIEQYSESSPQGPYTDIYALGAVLYYGLTGEALQEASDRTLQDTLPVLSAVGYRGVSQGFLAGIDAALKVYPRDRPISLESWRRMLDGPAREEVRQRPAESLAGHPVEAPGIGGSVRRWGIRALLLVVLVVYVISASEWMSVYGPEKGLALTGTAVVPKSVQEEAPQASAESPAEQFEEAPADAAQSAQTSGLPPGIGAAETCDGKPGGSACWMALENRPRCYLWNSHLDVNETATWSGGCAGGLAEGTGEITWVWGNDREHVSTGAGQLQQGKYHGKWVSRPVNGDVYEGSYVDHKRHGRWVLRFANGTVEEGPYVDDKRHGRWVLRFADGTVEEGPFVNGKRHGQWVKRGADGTVGEGPYEDGKREGQWVWRYANGIVFNGPYVDGKQEGQWVQRYADGKVFEGPYVDGKQEGQWVQRYADGTVGEGSYVDGKQEGQWVQRYADGTVGEGSYVDGKQEGQWVFRYADGKVFEGPYVDGKQHGQWVIRPASGNMYKITFVDGERQ